MQVGAPLYGLSMAIITAIRIGTSFVMAQWISIVWCCIANKQILRLCLLLPEQLNAANHKGMLQSHSHHWTPKSGEHTSGAFLFLFFFKADKRLMRDFSLEWADVAKL